tara:strand:- start:2673 stop:2819 length:147 start_codon:yes stop_codon:yes gene_type:complete
MCLSVEDIGIRFLQILCRDRLNRQLEAFLLPQLFSGSMKGKTLDFPFV